MSEAAVYCAKCTATGVKLDDQGLCMACRKDHLIRRLLTFRQGAGSSRERPTPRRPTLAQPGSEMKIAVMSKRLRRGEHLYHPDDAPLVAIDPITGRMTAQRPKNEAAKGDTESTRRKRFACCLLGAMTNGRCGCSMAAPKKKRKKKKAKRVSPVIVVDLFGEVGG